MFGNNPIWHFDGPGLLLVGGVPDDLAEGAGVGGLEVDECHAQDPLGVPVVCDDARYAMATFVTAGLSSELDRVAASVANDRSFAMAFVPSSRTIRLNLNRLRGPDELVWIDPTNGARRRVATSATGRMSLATPGANARGGEDWLLLAQVRSAAGRRNTSGVAATR